MTEMERVARRDILMQHARALHDYCKKHPACGVDDCPFFYIDEEGFDACHLNADVPPEEWEPDEWGDVMRLARKLRKRADRFARVGKAKAAKRERKVSEIMRGKEP